MIKKTILLLLILISLIFDIFLINKIRQRFNIMGIQTVRINKKKQLFSSRNFRYFYEPKGGIITDEGRINSDSLNQDEEQPIKKITVFSES